ncbi:hypothetical protein GCM10027418_09760 [Mariniluteicoccus endophyticus]
MTAQPLPDAKVGNATITIPVYSDLVNAGKHWTDGETTLGDLTAVGDVALGVLGAVLDPLNTLVGAAVGALMDILVKNISWLKETVDFLLGNPDGIFEHAQKWQRVSVNLAKTANEHAETAGQLPGWTGPSSDAYTQVLVNVNENFKAASGAAAKMADWVSVAGTVVAMFRDFIWNMIKDFVTEVVTAAIIAAASAVPSLGASVAAFTGWFSAKMALIGAKVTSKLAKLMRVLSKLAKKMGMSGKMFDDAARALSRVSQSLFSKSRNIIASGATRPAPRGRHQVPNSTIPVTEAPKLPKFDSKDLLGERGGDIYDTLKDANKKYNKPFVKPIDKGQTKGTTEFGNDPSSTIGDIQR